MTYLLKKFIRIQDRILVLSEYQCEKIKESGFDDYLLNTNLFNTEQLLKLNENNIKTRDQLADLSSHELIDILTDLERRNAPYLSLPV